MNEESNKEDFRALCAELAGKLDDLHCHYNVPNQSALINRARAALADEPAVTTPTVMESIELSEKIEAAGLGQVHFARDLLARPEPAPPADGEVADVVRWLRSRAGIPASPDFPAVAAYLTRAAELLQRQALVPVSVSERLPGPEDCDAEGRCWWGRAESDDWSADWTLATPEAIAEFCEFSPQTVWLPVHALPLPEVKS